MRLRAYFEIFWLTLIALCAGLMVSGIAGAAEKAKAASGGTTPAKDAAPAEGEVDISDIQSQYWKAHDREFEVIQNKLYTKENRIELTPLFGLYQRVDFQDTRTLGLSAAYHFSDMWGAELMGYKMFTNDSHILRTFKETRNATVEFNAERYYAGASALFTPVYGKFSFLGKKISHFDLYLSAGGGVVMTTAMRPAVSAGLGQKFWVSPKWNFRVEYRWMRYNDRVNTTQGATAVQNGGVGFYEDTVNDQNLLFGISYLFN